MPSALAILKYVPAVLCGLLVVAWVVTHFFFVKASWICDASDATGNFVQVICSSVQVGADPTEKKTEVRVVSTHGYRYRFSDSWGYFWYYPPTPETDGWNLLVPIPALLALMVPLAIGCLTRFRFPLWSYFAWTALVAAELAYYLR